MERERFRRLVQRAVDGLPAEVRARLDNVAVVVHREPTAEDRREAGIGPGEQLFGLYLGTPQTERNGYGMTLPDRIVIYQRPLERHFHPSELTREVQRTVLHELAHHFGIEDWRLAELGMD